MRASIKAVQSWQQLEVEWYRLHGLFPASRIKLDSCGLEYVIGDESWSGNIRPVGCLLCGHGGDFSREVIEPAMALYVSKNLPRH